jgi:general secretion pathway protein F
MPAFEYIALDPTGRERRGLLEGDTARQVRQQLREQAGVGLLIIHDHDGFGRVGIHGAECRQGWFWAAGRQFSCA